jgi:uncharacterized membrane protein YqjE
MAAPENADSGPRPSLFTSIRSLWSVFLAILYTRLDLLTVELEEEASRALQLIVVGLSALVGLGMAIFFFLFFLVARFWDERDIVLPIISGVCLLASIGLILAARRMVLTRPKFLSQTLAELRRDVESLRAEVKAAETKL